MLNLATLEPVDYLVIGHVAKDLIPDGYRLGGTVAYAALTAQAMGLRAGIVTSFGSDISLDPLGNIPVISLASEGTTTFENITAGLSRKQVLHHQAEKLTYELVPQVWRTAPILHIGPIAQEIDRIPLDGFKSSLIGLTPQGWYRQWDTTGTISHCDWTQSVQVLPGVGAVVISIDDVDKDEDTIEELALSSRILVVTEGPAGARLYWNGDLRRFCAHQVEEIDPTGAGDIFAAAFFVRLFATRDPWEAARFATQVASNSVQRSGLDGVPTGDEIQTCMMEVL
ncbi:MAG: hypothetical protein JXA13_05270 [Anaerolineales bacterium]|nr:hypothetical protein [Anaerolineales bacterium]